MISEEEAAKIAQRRGERSETLRRMVDGTWPGVDAAMARRAMDAAQADAKQNGVGFALIGPGDLGWTATTDGTMFEDYLVAIVSDDRRGVIAAGLASDMAGRASSVEACLIKRLRDTVSHPAFGRDAFDSLIMHLGPVRFA
jgi:hypothetical protein